MLTRSSHFGSSIRTSRVVLVGGDDSAASGNDTHLEKDSLVKSVSDFSEVHSPKVLLWNISRVEPEEKSSPESARTQATKSGMPAALFVGSIQDNDGLL